MYRKYGSGVGLMITESKHVATFTINNKISCVLTEPTLKIFSETHPDGSN